VTTTPSAGRRELVLIGGGEHARVVLDAARAGRDWLVVGFVDPNPHLDLQSLGPAWLGDDDAAASSLSGRHCILAIGGIGDPARRVTIAGRFERFDVAWASVIHPRSTVAAGATVSPGATILAGAVVNHGAQVGAHAIINTGAIIEHDVVLEPFGHVGPGAVIGGGTTVGRGTYVGLGARVRDHVRIGDGAVVGMGAVVVSDIPDGATVIGVPARTMRPPRQATGPDRGAGG